jgi:hypothetical protein
MKIRTVGAEVFQTDRQTVEQKDGRAESRT